MPKVLVVDGYQAMGEFLTDVFTAQGWHVTVVSGGKEALSILQQETGWLMLLGLSMPEMDGVELLRALQAIPSFSQRNAVVVMTARALSHEQQEALMAMGPKTILFKPFDLEQLLEIAHIWAPTPWKWLIGCTRNGSALQRDAGEALPEEREIRSRRRNALSWRQGAK